MDNYRPPDLAYRHGPRTCPRDLVQRRRFHQACWLALPVRFWRGADPVFCGVRFGVGRDAEPSEDLWDKLQEVWTTELGGEQGVAVGAWNGNDWSVRVQGRDTETAG